MKTLISNETFEVKARRTLKGSRLSLAQREPKGSRLSLFEQHLFDSPIFGTVTPNGWRPGQASPVLWPNEVHVWRIRLDDRWSGRFEVAISPDERSRAERFHFDRDRHRFIAGRASLRIILGRYLRLTPSALEFELNAFGKPRLVKHQDRLGVHFNLSHSHEMALVAISRHRQIGVDVEFMRPDFATDEVAEHFFSPLEVAELTALSPALKTEGFFNCWTRKEAYVKARGEGLSFPLDQFDVSIKPGAPALLGNRIDPDETARWQFHELSPGPEYKAALAVEGRSSKVMLWDFDAGK